MAYPSAALGQNSLTGTPWPDPIPFPKLPPGSGKISLTLKSITLPYSQLCVGGVDDCGGVFDQRWLASDLRFDGWIGHRVCARVIAPGLNFAPAITLAEICLGIGITWGGKSAKIAYCCSAVIFILKSFFKYFDFKHEAIESTQESPRVEDNRGSESIVPEHIGNSDVTDVPMRVEGNVRDSFGDPSSSNACLHSLSSPRFVKSSGAILGWLIAILGKFDKSWGDTDVGGTEGSEGIDLEDVGSFGVMDVLRGSGGGAVGNIDAGGSSSREQD
ncbi:hypothetical protein GH714_037371 [Hevea brasiliensis]|uniref:Uncharacterized protein n=1 Tax=Hevea brasiliensis TaxID=3981 RepID=A0A6A6L8D6_HEVBR|nr:hypothetical protein GH714_037371 [Hevea brasiliensis]